MTDLRTPTSYPVMWSVKFVDEDTYKEVVYIIPARLAWDAHELAIKCPFITPPSFGDCKITRKFIREIK